MKRTILFAYDGSVYADRALQDLNHLGFDNDDVELEVISAADIFVIPVNGEESHTAQLDIVTKLQNRSEQRVIIARQEAEQHATTAANWIRKRFPHWKVTICITEDPPTWGILNRIDTYKPQLVILGSHGRTGIERVLLGSVSQRVLSEANCSVRIVKGNKGAKERVLLCIDHSKYSLEAVQEVISRCWPASTEFILFSTIERPFINALLEASFTLAHLYAAIEEELKTERATIKAQYGSLFPPGQKVLVEVCRGNPKRTTIKEAADWGITTIFLGAKGNTDLENGGLGSVASTIAAHAQCTVEIVRKKQEEAQSA